jgi:hypothetical protein
MLSMNNNRDPLRASVAASVVALSGMSAISRHRRHDPKGSRQPSGNHDRRAHRLPDVPGVTYFKGFHPQSA